MRAETVSRIGGPRGGWAVSRRVLRPLTAVTTAHTLLLRITGLWVSYISYRGGTRTK
jgi:hypothetical protein